MATKPKEAPQKKFPTTGINGLVAQFKEWNKKICPFLLVQAGPELVQAPRRSFREEAGGNVVQGYALGEVTPAQWSVAIHVQV